MTAAMYLRKSRAEEHEPLDYTLLRHQEILTSYAVTHGLDVTGCYKEVASGDKLTGRPQMLRLLEELGRYDAILCMDIDRLGRGAMAEQGYIIESIRNAGAVIITPGKTYDPADDTDDSLIGFKALLAREEYKMIRGRLRRGALKALEEGCYLSNAPYGYRQTRVNKRPTLAIVEDEAAAVRLIFSRCIDGHGCQAIADELFSLGFIPRRGARFSRSTVLNMLKNPVYIGKVVWNQLDRANGQHIEQRVADGLHPPIIDKDVFTTASKLLMQRRHAPCQRRKTLENPLAGILYCAACGGAMLRRPDGSVACPVSGCCVSSRLDWVERILFEGLIRCLPKLQLEDPPPILCINDTNVLYRAEATRLRNRIERLYELLERGIYDADTFQARREELTRRFQTVQSAGEPAAASEHNTSAPIKSTLCAYWSGTAFERNQMLKSVLKRAEYEKPKGSPYGSAPVIRIVEWRG